MADATTAAKTLTDDYQEIITAACLLTLEEGLSVNLHLGSILPANNAAAHKMSTHNSPFSYSGGLKVYARIADNSKGTVTKISYTGV